MAELTEEAKVGMVAELKRLAGSTDEFFLRSILESNNFDFQVPRECVLEKERV